jgi:hypothetical protein
MKIFSLLQNIPKWLWVSLGVLGIVAPETAGYLNNAGYQVEWIDVVSKVTLWLVGFSPIPIPNKGGKLLSLAIAFFLCTCAASVVAQTQNFYRIDFKKQPSSNAEIAMLQDRNFYPWVDTLNTLGKRFVVFAASQADAKRKIAANKKFSGNYTLTAIPKDCVLVNQKVGRDSFVLDGEGNPVDCVEVKLYYPVGAFTRVRFYGGNGDTLTIGSAADTFNIKRQLGYLYSPYSRRSVTETGGVYSARNVRYRDCATICSECRVTPAPVTWAGCVSIVSGQCWCLRIRRPDG